MPQKIRTAAATAKPKPGPKGAPGVRVKQSAAALADRKNQTNILGNI